MQNKEKTDSYETSPQEDEAFSRSGGGSGLIERLRAFFTSETPAEEREKNAESDVQSLPAPVRRKTQTMMGRLVAFSRQRLDDVLVPRAEIIAVKADAPVRDLMEVFTRAQHSRLPVFRDTLDDILGMVHIKDLLSLLKNGAQPQPKKTRRGTAAGITTEGSDLLLPADLLDTTVEESGLMRPVLFAPPSMPAADLLLKMQATHLHMAVVVDEYGGTEGLVTIEDLIEQIVGEISDEHDEAEDMIVPVAGGYVVSARAPLEDLEAILKVDLLPPEQDEEVDTVGGLIFTMLGRVPARGEIIRHDSGVEFEILEADPRRIRRIRVRPAEPLKGPAVASAAE